MALLVVELNVLNYATFALSVGIQHERGGCEISDKEVKLTKKLKSGGNNEGYRIVFGYRNLSPSFFGQLVIDFCDCHVISLL